MEVLSTVESLSHYMESFADQIDEIGSWIRSWNQDQRNQANIADTDLDMTRSACLTIIVNAQAVISAIYLIDHVDSIVFSNLMAKGCGKTASDWISVLDDFKNADCSPVEHHCRVVLDVLSAASDGVRALMDDKLCHVVLSERLGQQARLAFQHYLFFHREHMKDAFLTLQGLLVHGMNRRSADLPLLVYRIEQMLSVVKSIVLTPSEELSHDQQNNVSLDISAWAVPKQ